MKKMLMRVRKRFKPIGTALIVLSCVTPHAIRKGQKFPDVRKLTPREQAERNQYTNLFEPGRWMWFEEYQERS
ncbi:hypothetical protein [Burkholderia sp. AU6039]|uniref:hypothetical protein n=1 Tax=Burkholderia sp. AU6039 TaxID=2015344 RepID=UPI00117E7B19|nr:hypothetical protein [Burkholderia sp. AU6039]